MALLNNDPVVLKSQIQRLQQELEERERKFEQRKQGIISQPIKDHAICSKNGVLEVSTDILPPEAGTEIVKKNEMGNPSLSGNETDDCVFQGFTVIVEMTGEKEAKLSNNGHDADISSRKSKRIRKSIDYAEIIKGNPSKCPKVDIKEVATLAFDVLIQMAKERPTEDFHLPVDYFSNYHYPFSSIISTSDNEVRNGKLTLDIKSNSYSKRQICFPESTKLIFERESSLIRDNDIVKVETENRTVLEENTKPHFIASDEKNIEPVESKLETTQKLQKGNHEESKFTLPTKLFGPIIHKIERNENLANINIENYYLQEEPASPPLKNMKSVTSTPKTTEEIQNECLEKFLNCPEVLPIYSEEKEKGIDEHECLGEKLLEFEADDNLMNNFDKKKTDVISKSILQSVGLEKVVSVNSQAKSCQEVRNIYFPKLDHNKILNKTGVKEMDSEEIFNITFDEEKLETIHSVIQIPASLSQKDNLLVSEKEKNEEPKGIAKNSNPPEESKIDYEYNIEEMIVESDTEDIFIDKSSQEGWEPNVTVISNHGFNKFNDSEKLNLSENIPSQTNERGKEILTSPIKSIQNQISGDLEDDTVLTQCAKTNKIPEKEYLSEVNANNISLIKKMDRNELRYVGNLRDCIPSKNSGDSLMETLSDFSGVILIKKRSSTCFKCLKNEPVMKIHYIDKENPLIAIQQLTALQILKLTGKCKWEERYNISLVEEIVFSCKVVNYIVIVMMGKFLLINYNSFEDFSKYFKNNCLQDLMACSLQNSYFATCSFIENYSSITVHKIQSNKLLSKEIEQTSAKLNSISAVSCMAKVLAGITSTGIILWSYHSGEIKIIINFDPVIESQFQIHWIQKEMDNLLYCFLKINNLPNSYLIVINPATGKHQILRKYKNGFKSVNNKICSYSVNKFYATEVIARKKLIIYNLYTGIEKATLESEALTTGINVFPDEKTNLILTGYKNGCLHTFMI